MSKALIIGDIHGCFYELQRLVDIAGLTEDDAIIGLGDIVDRGPETLEVLAFFLERPNAHSLQGNHERKHLRAARGELPLALSQRISRRQLGETYPEALAYMDTFPLFVERPEAILVHGYVEPGVPLDRQRPQVLAGTMGGDNYLRTQYDQPWYELWDGEKPVLVGHLDYLRSGEPFVYRDRVFGLDTGCVTGGRLTGLILPEFRFVSVASRGDHWHAIRQSYRLEKAARANRLPYKRPDYKLPWDFEAERVLEEIIAHVLEEYERTLSQLKKDPEYDLLSSRQRAKKYQALVKRSPVNALLHLARLGEMSKANARRVLKDADRAAAILEAIRHSDRIA